MKSKILRIVLVIISTIDCLMFLGMKGNWSGISSTLGVNQDNQSIFLLYFPFMVWMIMFLDMALCYVDYFLKKRIKAITIINIVLVSLSLVIIIVMFKMGCAEYSPFIFPDFLKYLCFVVAIYVLYFLIFVLPKIEWRRPLLTKILLLVGLTLSLFVLAADISINRITYHPVVYAVQDDYQIVFSCSKEATASLTVGDETYYETSAGYGTSRTKVHKVIVPMEKLDQAKGYTIYLQSYFYRGPFYSYKSRLISEHHDFKPISYEDGIDYYALSDVHHSLKSAILAASYHENMDFLVILGDIASECDSFETANLANLLAYKITSGEKPVLYARGNHETKNRYSEELYKYVGSVNQNFYFWYQMNVYLDEELYGHVKGFVLDFGEDHHDGWWEFGGSDHFDDYRKDQIAYMNDNKEFLLNDVLPFEYHLILNHIPVVYQTRDEDERDMKQAFCDVYNTLNIDVNLSGHQHQLFIFEPGLVTSNTHLYYNKAYNASRSKITTASTNNFNFHCFVVSRKSYDQAELETDLRSFTGVHGNARSVALSGIRKNETNIEYTNSKGKVLSMVSQYVNNRDDVGKVYGTKITYTK